MPDDIAGIILTSIQAGFLSWMAIALHMSSLGYTRDLWNIRAIDIPRYFYVNFLVLISCEPYAYHQVQQFLNIVTVVYSPSVCASKYFICIQLKRIFCPPGSQKDVVWWAFQILSLMIVAHYIALFFAFLFQCIPREKIWNTVLQGRCIDISAGFLSAGIINLIFDMGILCLPIWVIWHLHMPLERKLGVLSLFGVGIM